MDSAEAERFGQEDERGSRLVEFRGAGESQERDKFGKYWGIAKPDDWQSHLGVGAWLRTPVFRERFE